MSRHRIVFKIQRSPGPGPATVLVYNKSRLHTGTFPMDADTRWLFKINGNPEKLYVRGRVDSETGLIHLSQDDVLPPRNW